ncbi:MAG: hypothetical protein OXD42_00225 [Rhodospirillaceae bacterium]|nr:hypothetical protein [Rhodospirillaceae bacterium]
MVIVAAASRRKRKYLAHRRRGVIALARFCTAGQLAGLPAVPAREPGPRPYDGL